MEEAYSKIIGIGTYLPEKVIGNKDLEKKLDTSDEWIQTRTGIRERHIAADGELASDLALKASEDALTNAGVDRESLDLIVFATTTPDQIYPSSACILQRKLGIGGDCGAFDVQAVCSGFIYALTVGDAMIKAGRASRILVVGAEVYSHILDWSDRSTCILFGDGAGAAVIERSDSPGILASTLHADGSYADKLSVPGHVGHGTISGRPYTVMDGGAIFKQAIRVMSEASLKVCREGGVDVSQVDFFIPHQANQRIMLATAERLGIGSRLVSTVGGHANTSAASIPLALSSVWNSVKAGQHLLLTSVGGGLSWGAALVRI